MPSGDKFDGTFKDDKPHGIGLEYKNGQIFKNEYREGNFFKEIELSNESAL